MTARVIGLDLSIAATGIARADGTLLTTGGPASRGDHRLDDIVTSVAELEYGDGVPTGPRGGSLERLLQFCEHHGIPTRDEPEPDDDMESGWDGVPPGRAVLEAELPDEQQPAFSDN